MIEEQDQIIPFELNLIVTDKNNKPCIELRKVTTNPDIIKLLVSCAYHGQPVTVLPVFKDSMKSLSSLMEKGIIHKAEDGQFYYTF